MDRIKALSQRNPVVIARETGQQLKRLRLAKDWTQEELAEKSGVAVSTLKLLEASGNGSFQRLIRIAVALGVDGELRGLLMGKAGNITRRYLRQLGNTQGVRRVDETIGEVLHAVADWQQHAQDHGLSKSISSMVGQQHGLSD